MGLTTKPVVVLFDVDETLMHTGGAGARSWRAAFNELYGIPADIGAHTSHGETDPEVAKARLHRSLSPSQVFVVGDTPRDIVATHAAGAVAVGVATGRYSIEELSGADHVLGSLEEPFPGL